MFPINKNANIYFIDGTQQYPSTGELTCTTFAHTVGINFARIYRILGWIFTTKNSIIVNAAVIETAKMWLKYKLIINIKELKNMEINVHMTIVMIINCNGEYFPKI